MSVGLHVSRQANASVQIFPQFSKTGKLCKFIEFRDIPFFVVVPLSSETISCITCVGIIPVRWNICASLFVLGKSMRQAKGQFLRYSTFLNRAINVSTRV